LEESVHETSILFTNFIIKFEEETERGFHFEKYGLDEKKVWFRKILESEEFISA